MSLGTWSLYVAAVLILTLSPGPSVLMCVSTSVNLGTRHAMVAAAGSTTAIVGIMALSALGLGAALAASETLFDTLKWAGAIYLAYLGITSLLSSKSEIAVTGRPYVTTWRQLFLKGFLVGASNPKALLFFGALFPQFIDPHAPREAQFLILGATFVFFEMFWLTIYALSAARAKQWLQRPRRAAMFNRVTGVVFLVAAGLLVSRRTPA